VKISCKSVRKFLHKVASKQINRQTNNDDYISSLAEEITRLRLSDMTMSVTVILMEVSIISVSF